MEIKDSEVVALINLLDDGEDEIISAVTTRIEELGVEVIPSLEKAWEKTLNVSVQGRIENIINDIQFSDVKKDLKNWSLMGADDLLTGAIVITRFQFPDIKASAVTDVIAKIKNDVWLEINDNLTALEKVRVMNHIIYGVHKFAGNYSQYYAPQNYFINQVLESKKGNPVTLGIIYITIAQMLGLPIYGVNLPKNFILAYKDVYATNKQDSVLFYINPYNKGAVLGRREIDFFLNQQNINPDEMYYYPCSNYDIIIRLIMNLVNSFESTGQAEKGKRIKKLLEVLTNKG